MIRAWGPRSRALFAIAVAAALAGCASDNARYACTGYPSQPLCLPPTAVYGLTEGEGPVLRASAADRLARRANDAASADDGRGAGVAP